LHYCLNIAFYLLLKSKGRPIRDHPVINQLIKTRIIIEKLGPLDKKLKYQIDKLLKLATVGDTQSSTEGEIKDPLQFKPNPENLVAKDDEIGNENGLYVPNPLASAYFDDKEDKKKGDARALRRAAKSSIIQSLREEFSDQPEELDVTGGGRKEKIDAREAELEKFEEENMVRLSVSKKDKKNVNAI